MRGKKITMANTSIDLTKNPKFKKALEELNKYLADELNK